MLFFLLYPLKRSTSYICSLPLTSRAAGVAPSRDQTGSPGPGTDGGQGDGGDVAVEFGGAAQLDQHDVVVQVVAVVSGVTDDLGRVDELLCAFVDSNVVLTQTHLDTAADRDVAVEQRQRRSHALLCGGSQICTYDL